MIYLDWAASAPAEPEALDALREVSSLHFANPSSPHAAGRAAHNLLEDARGRLSSLLCQGEIVFTSGATESNGAILLSLLAKYVKAETSRRVLKIVTSAIEHPSLYEQARALEGLGIRISFVAAGSDGIVDPERVAECLDSDTALVSLMLVNNETGAVQRIREVAAAVRDFSERKGRRILVHTDAAQGFCKIPFDPVELGVDAMSLSGHKMGGPRGIGALWLAPGVKPDFLAAGGGQESGRRPGTENLAGICAFVTAAEKRLSRVAEELPIARGKADRAIGLLRELPRARIFPESRATSAGEDAFSPYILSFGFPPLPGEVVVRLADSKGFLIGTGSACASRKKARTRILESMGIRSDVALSAVRVSFGPATPAEDLDSLIALLKDEVPPLLALTRGRGQ